jgi:3-isopropylmalate/(R)-2-methylmalate dehydratase small subunit
MVIKDRVLEVYPDNVSAELIAHTGYVASLTQQGLRDAAMKAVDPDFHEKLKSGGVMAAGWNFGCNSSREWAPAALYHAGVKLLIARSFARIFYRSAINIGLIIMECPDITEWVKRGDELEADVATGEIKNLTTGVSGKGTVLPESLLGIMTAGGLMEVLKAESGKK